MPEECVLVCSVVDGHVNFRVVPDNITGEESAIYSPAPGYQLEYTYNVAE